MYGFVRARVHVFVLVCIYLLCMHEHVLCAFACDSKEIGIYVILLVCYLFVFRQLMVMSREMLHIITNTITTISIIFFLLPSSSQP